MRALAFVLLLASSAPAQEAAREETGERAQLARERVDALPEEARIELKAMYRRYKDAVARKLDAGWHPRLLSEAVIEGIDEPFKPARLVTGMIELRKKELARLKQSLAKLDGDDPYSDKRLRAAIEAKSDELAALVSRNNREKGLCRDWSDLIWSEFTSMELEQWRVRDERREARPYHTAAIACSPADEPAVCLAFDPWEDGRPNVFAFTAWNESEPGGRFPAEYFLHVLPDKPKAGKSP